MKGPVGMHDPIEIAKAFRIEGQVDFDIARLLSGTDYHSRTIYFAQQAVEKTIKAMLALKGIFTTDHNLSSMFRAVYQPDLADVDEVVAAIDALERHGARVRFPLYQRADLPLWIPSRGYREEDAAKALRTAERVFQTLGPHLQRWLGEENRRT